MLVLFKVDTVRHQTWGANVRSASFRLACIIFFHDIMVTVHIEISKLRK